MWLGSWAVLKPFQDRRMLFVFFEVKQRKLQWWLYLIEQPLQVALLVVEFLLTTKSQESILKKDIPGRIKVDALPEDHT